VFRLAAGLDGHPDNAAACLSGGLTVAWTGAVGPRMMRLAPLPWIRPVVCVAPFPMRTDVARGLLPDAVPHRDAAASAGRSALLVAALCCPGGDDPPLTPPAPGGTHPPSPPLGGAARPPVPAGVLRDATEDWLHQGYRASAMPETYALLRRLRAAGLPAVVSGAGPSVLVLLDAREEPDLHQLDSLGSIVAETGIAWHISSLDVERLGARILHPESPSDC
jgi:homoserine kinase